MKKMFVTAALAATATVMVAAAPAAASVTSFTGGAASPSAGFTVIDNFDADTGITGTQGLGADYILTTNHDGNGAPPANSVPFDTNYLSVLGGGTVSINFSALTALTVHAFEFDWGSIDAYNTLVIHGSGGDKTIVPGSASFPNDANGNQINAGTNGLFKVVGDKGETFSSITLSSGANSFEVDNLAIAGVPEPASWAMMLVGFGGLGALLRRRRGVAAAATA
jgi:hypothetical protein